MTTLTTKHQRHAALRPLSPESVASLAAAWDVRMVHESNAIEGNSLTLRETELVLSKGVTVSGKPLKDHIEALNLAKAWDNHEIARIHPFTDGNGRAARLAMNFVLLAAGYPPVSIPTDLRMEYHRALEAADSGDFPTWLGFITRQLDQELDQWLEALDDRRQQT